MNISIELDHPNVTFTIGDTIYGRVVVYCPNITIVVSEISASLVGETTSVLTDTTRLFMNHREEEKHCVGSYHTLPIGIYQANPIEDCT